MAAGDDPRFEAGYDWLSGAYTRLSQSNPRMSRQSVESQGSDEETAAGQPFDGPAAADTETAGDAQQQSAGDETVPEGPPGVRRARVTAPLGDAAIMSLVDIWGSPGSRPRHPLGSETIYEKTPDTDDIKNPPVDLLAPSYAYAERTNAAVRTGLGKTGTRSPVDDANSQVQVHGLFPNLHLEAYGYPYYPGSFSDTDNTDQIPNITHKRAVWTSGPDPAEDWEITMDRPYALPPNGRPEEPQAVAESIAAGLDNPRAQLATDGGDPNRGGVWRNPLHSPDRLTTAELGNRILFKFLPKGMGDDFVQRRRAEGGDAKGELYGVIQGYLASNGTLSPVDEKDLILAILRYMDPDASQQLHDTDRSPASVDAPDESESLEEGDGDNNSDDWLQGEDDPADSWMGDRTPAPQALRQTPRLAPETIREKLHAEPRQVASPTLTRPRTLVAMTTPRPTPPLEQAAQRRPVSPARHTHAAAKATTYRQPLRRQTAPRRPIRPDEQRLARQMTPGHRQPSQGSTFGTAIRQFGGSIAGFLNQAERKVQPSSGSQAAVSYLRQRRAIQRRGGDYSRLTPRDVRGASAQW